MPDEDTTVAEETSETSETDEGAVTEEPVATGAEGQETEEQKEEAADFIELDEKRYTEADIRAWRKAHDDREKWVADNTRRAQENAAEYARIQTLQTQQAAQRPPLTPYPPQPLRPPPNPLDDPQGWERYMDEKIARQIADEVNRRVGTETKQIRATVQANAETERFKDMHKKDGMTDTEVNQVIQFANRELVWWDTEGQVKPGVLERAYKMMRLESGATAQEITEAKAEARKETAKELNRRGGMKVLGGSEGGPPATLKDDAYYMSPAHAKEYDALPDAAQQQIMMAFAMRPQDEQRKIRFGGKKTTKGV